MSPTRRHFLTALGAAAFAPAALANETIPGFEKTEADPDAKAWQPISDRKIRMGLVGYGVCRFGAAFSFQDHPNVEVVAVSDLIPEQRAEFSRVTRCEKTCDSIEEMVKDDSIEAIFVATDAPSHAEHCILAMEHGKHVCTAVPAVFGNLEDADRLLECVTRTGMHYMMFETSCYHPDVCAMRHIYNAGGFGRMLFTEGEYYHFMPEPIPSYKDWRVGLPPQWYPTHSNGYYTGVTGGAFTEVTCMGTPSVVSHLQPEHNIYGNPFGTEVALFRTTEGGSARMAVSWDTPGLGGEKGRVRGERGSMTGMEYQGMDVFTQADLQRPGLPPGVEPGGHGGSHGYLCEEFVTALLEDRTPLIDIAQALNMTVSGIIAHESAIREGETMKIPVYEFEL